MKRREWLTISAAGLTVALNATASDRVTLRRRLRCVPGIPTRDYNHREHSRTAFAMSASAVTLNSFPAVASPRIVEVQTDLLRGPVIVTEGFEAVSAIDPTVPTPGLRAKEYQFVDPTSLRIDHCSISEMAAVIDEGGEWVVSLRADQNPVVTRDRRRLIDEVVVDDIRPSVLQTSQTPRNLFHVRVFGYAARGSQARTPGEGATDPAVFEAIIPPFWVQRARPRRMRWTGSLSPSQAARAFVLVDRIGVEFSYELQAGLEAVRR